MKKLRLLVTSLTFVFLLVSCGGMPTCLYTVSFDSNGGSSISSQMVVENKFAAEPNKPTREPGVDKTYTFDAWYKVVDGKMEEKPFDFANTPITENIDLKAKWSESTRLYTITFDSAGGNPVAPVTGIEYGSIPGEAKEPTPPTRKSSISTDYKFAGWVDSQGNPFYFSTTKVYDDITLTAVWDESVRKYTITFDSNGGDPVAPVTGIEYGSIPGEAKKPNDPNRDSDQAATYAFDNWEDPDGNIFDFAASKVYGDITLTAIWTPTYKKYTISFDLDGGQGEIDPIPNITYGTVPGGDKEPASPTKKSTISTDYTFGGWEGPDGKMFNFETSKIYGDTTLKAIWNNKVRRYTVYFDSAGGSHVMSLQTYYNTPITEARKPKDPTKEDDIWKYKFDYWYENDSMQEFDFDNTLITGDTHLTAKWSEDTQKVYKINGINTNKLLFLTADKEKEEYLHDIDIKAGESFKFRMRVHGLTNTGETYVVPNSINIYVKGSSEPILDGYTITPNQDYTEAEVEIKGDKVIGAIEVRGEAIKGNYYHYQVTYNYGLEKIDSGEVIIKTDAPQPLKLSFTPLSGYTLPKAENIYVQFDKCGGEDPLWISPGDLDEEAKKEYCSYNEDNGELTIQPDHIDKNINIVARSNSYKLLENLTWDQISKVSFQGVAPLAFYLGEEKIVKLNNINHRVRIIGFNHDYTDPEHQHDTRVGITFEFANLVTGSNTYTVSTQWSSYYNTDFPTSTINNVLNNNDDCIFSKLPAALQNVIKTVSKPVFRNWEYTHYDTKLFPLSSRELTETAWIGQSSTEGTIYAFYKGEGRDTKENRNKTGARGTTPYNYWLRSPESDMNCMAKVCKANSDDFYATMCSNESKFAPAFCV